LEGILARIVERTLADVAARRSRISRRELEEQGRDRSRRRIPLDAAVRRRSGADPVRFITEIKKASPSRGLLREDLDPRAQAGAYRENGAAAISVVTEPHFFQGEDAFLEVARGAAPDLPLLRKDFHVDELQILEAAAGEADALLFLVAALDPVQLRDYLQAAGAFGLGHLVEVGNRREGETALKAGARVIGVNNRDLATFRVDPSRTEAVLPLLREAGVAAVAESGIHDRDAVLRFERLGVDALLVGEALVTASDPGARLRKLRGAGEEGALP
jgi:indole-3-glycerol phosphate synthase